MKPGDVVWVEFPGGAGRAQAGRRPSVVVQTAEASQRLSTVLVIPLTSKQDALRFPGTVFDEPDSSNGLRRPSVALVFQLTAVDRRIVGARLGHLDDETMTMIWTSFDEITGRSLPGS